MQFVEITACAARRSKSQTIMCLFSCSDSSVKHAGGCTGGRGGRRCRCRNETSPTLWGHVRRSPNLIRFSITWVNRGQWERSKHPHVSPPHYTQPHTPDCGRRPVWLPVRESHPPRQVPSSARKPSFFFFFSPRRVRYGGGVLMNARWQQLGRRAVLPLHISPQVTSCATRGEKSAETQTGAGHKPISSPRLKTHLSQAGRLIESDSRGSTCK